MRGINNSVNYWILKITRKEIKYCISERTTTAAMILLIVSLALLVALFSLINCQPELTKQF